MRRINLWAQKKPTSSKGKFKMTAFYLHKIPMTYIAKYSVTTNTTTGKRQEYVTLASMLIPFLFLCALSHSSRHSCTLPSSVALSFFVCACSDPLFYSLARLIHCLIHCHSYWLTLTLILSITYLLSHNPLISHVSPISLTLAHLLSLSLSIEGGCINAWYRELKWAFDNPKNEFKSPGMRHFVPRCFSRTPIRQSKMNSVTYLQLEFHTVSQPTRPPACPSVRPPVDLHYLSPYIFVFLPLVLYILLSLKKTIYLHSHQAHKYFLREIRWHHDCVSCPCCPLHNTAACGLPLYEWMLDSLAWSICKYQHT